MQSNNQLQEELAGYFEKGRLLKFDKDEIVMRSREQPRGVYMIQRGFIKVYSIDDSGKENLHLIYKSGEIFPLIWAFKGLPRNVFYQALAPSRLWLLPTDEFRELAATSHSASQALVRQLVNQFHILTERLENLEYNSAADRVVYRLVFMAGRFGVKNGKQVIIDAPITHQIIADATNLVRETVSRQIELLEKQNLLEHKGRKIVIKDIGKLRALLTDPPSMPS